MRLIGRRRLRSVYKGRIKFLKNKAKVTPITVGACRQGVDKVLKSLGSYLKEIYISTLNNLNLRINQFRTSLA